jgi:hypothetical protein
MSYPHIHQARAEVSRRVGSAPWFRGAGYGSGADGSPVIVVNVSVDHPQVRHWVGSHSMGVPVYVQVVEDLHPPTKVG